MLTIGEPLPALLTEAVQPPKASYRMIDHRFDVDFLRNIGANKAEGLATARRQGLAFIGAPPGADHTRTLGDKASAILFADAAGRARHDGDFSVKLSILFTP